MKGGERSPSSAAGQLWRALNKSPFATEGILGELNVGGTVVPYDPKLVSVVAARKDPFPREEKAAYRKVSLPPSSESKACPYDLRAYVKDSKNERGLFFIILPGAYSRGLGGHTYPTAKVLEKHFGDINIISMDGYLSPHFLKDRCTQIPYDVVSLSRDIYLRLSNYILEKDGAALAGIVGFSGGGGLVPMILSHDDRLAFNLGGIAFSPTLHGRISFGNLDNLYQQQKAMGYKHSLTSSDFSNILWVIGDFFRDQTGIDWIDIIEKYRKDPSDFRSRFDNEFTVSDLRRTLKALDISFKSIQGELSYYNVYINTGFRNGIVGDYQDINSEYDKATSLLPVFEQLEKKLLIYFSQDDPVLSTFDNSSQPEDITEILNSARRNPHITVFNPRYGAHIGALLDPMFADIIGSFFGLSLELSPNTTSNN